MQYRNGFVSNSSSCSFVIMTDKMTIEQFLKAKYHLVEEEDADGEQFLEVTGWVCYEKDKFYVFSTSIDNFCMISLIKSMGISPKDMLHMHHSNARDKRWKADMEKEYGVTIVDD